MAIKNKNENKNEENVIEQMTQNDNDLGLGLETSFSNGGNSTWNIDTTNLDKININDLNIGDEFDGMPEFQIYDNSDKTNNDGSPRKWDSICCRFIDIEETDEYGEQTGEFVEAYLPCPRPDKNGFIKNVFSNGFYHGTFCLIYSYLRTIDESNVLDSDGNIINTINKINLVKLIEKLNEYSKMECKVYTGADGDENHLTFMITSME